jgi:hypothetical protein
LEIGASGTSAFANTEIYGGSQGVKLFYNTSTKLQTTSDGIDVTGTVTDDGATHDGDVTFTGDSYNVLWDKSDNALELADNALIKVGDGDDMTIRSDGTYPRIKANNIIVESNNADQAIYFRSNDTGDIADFDTGTQFYFQQYNDNNEMTTYSRLLSISADVTDGSEDGRFQFQNLKDGTNTTSLILDASYLLIMNDQSLGWYTYNGNYSTYLSPLTPTEDRIIKLPDRDGVVQVVDRQVMTSNLAVGWHTIAVFQGRDDSPQGANQRFHAKFTLLEYAGSRHQAFTFYAQSMFGQDEGLQVIGNSTFGTDVVTAIRIKSSTDTLGLYAGAAIQVYVADATNNLVLYLDEADFDNDESGTTYGNVILKTGVADASDPGDVGYSTATWSTFAEDVQIGIDSIEPGGIGVTGNLLTQSNIVLEGATADAHETIITATDPTADRTITLPDATGTVPVFSTAPTSAITDGTNGQVLTTDGSGGLSFTTVSGGGGGGTFASYTANATLSAFVTAQANTSGGAFTLTLPASPSANDEIIILDTAGSFGTNNLTVGRNGNTIQGNASDLICDIDGAGIRLHYTGSDWRVFAIVGTVNGNAVTVSATQTLTNKTLTNPTVNNYTEGTVAIGTVSSAHTFDLTSGTFQTATLTASTACTFTMPTAATGKSFVLKLSQPALTGNGTATFTSVKFPGGTAPTITAAAGSIDIISFVSDGTNWYGNAIQDLQ